MNKKKNIIIHFVLMGFVVGFLIGACKSVYFIIQNRYSYYGMYYLIIFALKQVMTSWILLIVLISLALAVLYIMFLWAIRLITNSINSFAEIKIKNVKNAYDFIIATAVVFLLIVMVGYLANCYFLWRFFTVESILSNMGIFVLCMSLIAVFYWMIKHCRYDWVKDTIVKLKPGKICKGILIVMISIIFGLNLYTYTRETISDPARPNVLLIVVDTLRKDHLGCYGYFRNTSPNIDKLGEGGVIFEKCYSQSSWTLPSVGTIMTSLYPSVHQSVSARKKLQGKHVTLSEVMKNSFYKTIGIISHVFVSSDYNFNQGFDVFDESCVTSEFSDVGKSSTSEYLTKRAIKYLRKNKHRRFFMYIHFFDPHYNYILHHEYDYFPKYDGDLRSNQDIRELWSLRDKMKAEDVGYLRSLYDSEIVYTDESIGEILNELKRLDIYDKTLIVVTGDHGEELMERNWIGHTRTLYGEVIDVPLIIKLPGLKMRGVRIDENVGIIDIFPTIVRECGIDLNGKIRIQGKDLYECMGDEGMKKERAVFSEVSFSDSGYNKQKEAFKEAIICGKWKMIKNLEDNSVELYDLEQDALEAHNVAIVHEKVTTKLKEDLRVWHEKNLVLFGDRSAGDTMTMRDEVKEKLKNLGYIN